MGHGQVAPGVVAPHLYAYRASVAPSPTRSARQAAVCPPRNTHQHTWSLGHHPQSCWEACRQFQLPPSHTHKVGCSVHSSSQHSPAQQACPQLQRPRHQPCTELQLLQFTVAQIQASHGSNFSHPQSVTYTMTTTPIRSHLWLHQGQPHRVTTTHNYRYTCPYNYSHSQPSPATA